MFPAERREKNDVHTAGKEPSAFGPVTLTDRACTSSIDDRMGNIRWGCLANRICRADVEAPCGGYSGHEEPRLTRHARCPVSDAAADDCPDRQSGDGPGTSARVG